MDIIKFISEKTLMPTTKVSAFLYTAPHRYKKYFIPKRNGGVREIAQPSKELKYMQRIIISELSSALRIHDSAYANSIKPKDLENCLKKHNLDEYLASMELLGKLFFYKKTKKSSLTMSIGAPSSPFLSNAILYDFDAEVAAICHERNIEYTRYADDLTFSTNVKGSLLDFPKEIKRILRKTPSPKLKVNDSKTIFASKKCNRHITGVVVNNSGDLSIGRKKKRYISSLIHKFTLNLLDKNTKNHLKGYLAYINNIEPIFIRRMAEKYGANAIDSIRKFNEL
jgi:RNA-directed DNA polymerase